MTNYWAIAIGINQYQHFQPLMYAERDAEVLHQFWTQEAGIPAQQCLLLGDSTPEPGRKPASGTTNNLPTHDNIVDALTELCQRRLHADDVLWVFFSGYGVHYQGQDYLMPIDADPAQVATTAISMETLFGILQAAPTQNILTLLDVNRSQGMLGGVGVGRQTTQLVQDVGLSVILSSRPDQFSHETLMLRQGLFTTALLDGLRNQGCLTPEQLMQFLRDRLPSLSEHHWRPRQDVLGVIPDTLRYQLMLPGKSLSTGQPGTGDGDLIPPDGDSSGDIIPPEQPLDPENGDAPPLSPDEQSWRKVIRFGAIGLLVLMGLVVARNLKMVIQPIGAGGNDPSQPAPTLPTGETGNPTVPGSPLPGSVPDGQPTSEPLPGGDPTQSEEPAQGGEPLPGGDPTVPPSPPPEALPSDPANVPTNPQVPADPNELPAVGSVGGSPNGLVSTGALAEDHRRLLDQARASLTLVRADAPSNQVSEIVEAIRQVRQIQPNQPLYDEAQHYAERWSGMVLDMAVGRAARRNGGDSLVAARNYQSAIAAAQLVSTDYPDLHNAARRSIAVWSQETMDLANLHASERVFGLAIDVAKYVPQNTPAYAESQRAIALWQAQLNTPTTAQQTADLANP